MDKTKCDKMNEIQKAINDLKRLKRKIYCSEYYLNNRENILKNARDKLTLSSNKTTQFKVDKQKITIHFD